MLLAQGILIKEHRVRFVADLTLTVFIFVFLFFKFLLANDFFTLKIQVEQDLSRVFFQ